MTSASNSPKNIRVGFVGLSSAGWASTTIAPSILQPSLEGKYDIAAVSTTSETSAQDSADKYSKVLEHPVKAYFGDTSKIASDPDVDLVIVSVKAPQHKQAVLPVIEAKKDFFIEWPAGTSLEETEEIAAAAHKQGVRSIVGLQGRHSAVAIKTKELLASGVIGTVRSTNVMGHIPREWKFWAPFSTDFNQYILEKKNGTSYSTSDAMASCLVSPLTLPDPGATPLTIPIGHQLDTLTNVLGDFSEVTATAATVYPEVTIVGAEGNPIGQTRPSEFPDHFIIAGRLKSGVLANIFWRTGYSSTAGRRQFIWEIEGEKGAIRMESNEPMASLPSISEPELFLNGVKVDMGGKGGAVESVGLAFKEFAEGAGEHATIDDAVKHKRLLGAIETSAKEGKRIVLG